MTTLLYILLATVIFLYLLLLFLFWSLRDSHNRMERAFKSDLSLGRREQSEAFQSLREEVARNILEQTRGQREQWESFEKKLDALREDNKNQLEKMRNTVDEKLQGALEKRLSASFKQVSERLKEVYEGLGEMKNLAHGVGDLKKLFSNIKTRGTWGEYQLGNILGDLLAPEQYEHNVSLGEGIVEYAVKLPGTTEDTAVYLPLDAKFPQESYLRIQEAQESADQVALKSAYTNLEREVKREAQRIKSKYINPPKTTDFALMFFPTEGLYAEVLRRPNLADFLQREYRIMIAGPTTLSALLNALSVGFQTLTIQKRSSEIWQLLGEVKHQFGAFSGLLNKVQKKLQEASDEMDKVSKKSRTIEKGLTRVDSLSESQFS